MTTMVNLFTNTDMFSMVDSMSGISRACPITLCEPENVNEAIQLHEERVKLLKVVKSQGFETIAEYKKYKEAEKLIAKHQEKMAAKKAGENAKAPGATPVPHISYQNESVLDLQ